MIVQKPDIEALRAKVDATLDAMIGIQYSDDYAYSNGSYDRARDVWIEATRVLNDALKEHGE